jgi:hypothetical protein
MKHYAVEMIRISYVTIHVEAKDEDEAETFAWQVIENGDHGDAHWELADITEQQIPANVKEAP